MSATHVLKYHLVIPAVIFAGLLVIGVPIGTAIFIGMMAGCMSMMLMMAGSRQDDLKREVPEHEERSVSREPE
jgi:MFS superfamily sulfate permease-like transporter